MSRANLYYLAVVAPAAVNEKVRSFKQWMYEQFGCKAAMKSPAHITLLAPFKLAADREQHLLEILKSFSSPIAEWYATMDGFSHFGDRVLFIHVESNPGLLQLRNTSEEHFQKALGNLIKKDERPFHPHVTIANRDMEPEHFEKAWAYFSPQSFQAQFRGHTISLLRLDNGRWSIIAEKSLASVKT
jgi:2'-5' RNA ligase